MPNSKRKRPEPVLNKKPGLPLGRPGFCLDRKEEFSFVQKRKAWISPSPGL
jgi:hypothetical protein